jgi:hypothetical protein
METNPFRAQRLGHPPASSGSSPASLDPMDESARSRPDPPANTRAGVAGRVRRWAAENAAGKIWWVRAPLVLVLAWILWRHVGDRNHSSIFGGVNLAFHEIGHVFFGFFGSELLMFAGGTILELAIPLVAAAMLARQGDAFGVSVGLFWFGTALHSVSIYVSDTRAQRFGRVSLGDYDGPDDWTYILDRFDLIRHDLVIGGWMRAAALLAMAGAIVYGVWILRLMATQRGVPAGEASRPIQ